VRRSGRIRSGTCWWPACSTAVSASMRSPSGSVMTRRPCSGSTPASMPSVAPVWPTSPPRSRLRGRQCRAAGAHAERDGSRGVVPGACATRDGACRRQGHPAEGSTRVLGRSSEGIQGVVRVRKRAVRGGRRQTGGEPPGTRLGTTRGPTGDHTPRPQPHDLHASARHARTRTCVTCINA